MNITPIYVVWIAASLVQLGILVRMWWIRAEIKFPIFFSYILLQVAQFPFAFLLYRRSINVSGNFYFKFYLQVNVLSVVLGLACAYEVFSRVLNDYQSLRPLKISLFRWAGLLLLILGVVVALKLPGGGSGPELELMHQLDRTSRIVQAGLLLCVLFFPLTSAWIGRSRFLVSLWASAPTPPSNWSC